MNRNTFGVPEFQKLHDLSNDFSEAPVKLSVSGLPALCAVLFTVPAAAFDGPTIAFNRDIRPILSDNCFFCHGPDNNKREAGLRLDTESGLHGSSDNPGVVVPGKPDESPMMERITSDDPDLQMPPPHTGKSLTAEQIQTLRQWIAEGASYEGHWSFLPIAKPEVSIPAEQSSSGLVSSEAAERSAAVDALLNRSLQASGLPVSPEADRVTLIRRASFDLTGLPPTPEDVEAFLNDRSPDAWPALIERLLDSPAFGERMAVWWLDLVRYADTVGYHGDQMMSVSPFRRYVIDAFNDNLPFDRFTREQLAGDLLSNPTQQQLIASGYNRLGMMSAEGGVQPREYLAKYAAERVRNATGTWLGITLGCAECHDHKFDPLTTREFYEFEAFFADIEEKGLYSGAGRSGNWGPEIPVPTAAQEEQLNGLEEELASLQKLLDTATPELAAEQARWEQQVSSEWIPLTPLTLSTKSETTLRPRSDGAVLASGPRADLDSYTLEFRDLPENITALRIDVLPDPSLPQQGPGRAGNGNFVISEVRAHVVSADSRAQIGFSKATATHEQEDGRKVNPYGRWAAAAAIDLDEKGDTWGWAVLPHTGTVQSLVIETAADVTLHPDATLRITIDQNHDNPGHTLGCFRILAATEQRPNSAETLVPSEIRTVLGVPSGERTQAQAQQLAAYYRSVSPLLDETRKQLSAAKTRAEQLRQQITTTLITRTVEPRMIRVLPRGNWMDDSGEAVQPAFPAAVPTSFSAEEGRRLTRLDLAEWIVAPDNPLTARVTVNRIWHLLFGGGISGRLDDLGAQGEWPSHPELLDFLAAEFRSDWDVKMLIRSVMLSDAYRRSSVPAPAAAERDPYNTQLARQGRFRLDAEFVRDNALAVSGLLHREVGGPSVFPYQPKGYWAYLNFPTREWQQSEGRDLYRRGLYTHWQRQYLHPELQAFDAPSREECTASRSRSNTPLQALTLLNDPVYVEAARAFAARVLQSEEPQDDTDRIHYAFRLALSRPPSDAEVKVVSDILVRHRTDYTDDREAAQQLTEVGASSPPPDIPAEELAAWTSVARVIMNLHEFIVRS